ncbi:MAG: cytochrome b pre-mRNA-processing protein 3 [Variibacter sp.]|jgi:cytochrome b pre-mRNA-processing protein 3|nr:cytochrome b pre-mRNA-processing protein 3 [Variibacter sp.]
MPLALFKRSRSQANIAALYGVIVAQARQRVFYADYGVPDTLAGRFDMIVLHLALVLRRLRADGESGRQIGQSVFDAFCTDMDNNLRELGISDVGVPRRMRRFGEAFYGRAEAYDNALNAAGDDLLTEALRRNVFSEEAAGKPERLARYVRESERGLRGGATESIACGDVRFPDAAEFTVRS